MGAAPAARTRPARCSARAGCCCAKPSITDPILLRRSAQRHQCGSSRRSEIAAALGRPSSAVAHLLDGLADIGIDRAHGRRAAGKRHRVGIAEPVVRLRPANHRRYEPELVAGRADRVWERSGPTVAAKIYGPHFERPGQAMVPVPRERRDPWRPAERGPADRDRLPEHPGGHELDVVVTDDPGSASTSPRSARPSQPIPGRSVAAPGGLSTCAGCCLALALTVSRRLLLFSRRALPPTLRMRLAAGPTWT